PKISPHPAPPYPPQFIGQPNPLRAEIRNGIATCGSLRWPAGGTGDAPDGNAVFSLRPETIHFAANLSAQSPVRFTARIRQQIYAGSTELLELDCAAETLRARIPSR